MKKIKVEVTGISPLLQNRFKLDDENEKPKKRNIAAEEDDVEGCLYRFPDGKIYQPALHFHASMKKAGTKFKIKGRNKETYKTVMGCGMVQIEPDAIIHKNQNWEVDIRAIVNRTTKGRRARKRPVFKNWNLAFNIEYDEAEINFDTLKQILDYAGRYVGVGDFRPEKGGSFGRFMVTEFKEI